MNNKQREEIEKGLSVIKMLAQQDTSEKFNEAFNEAVKQHERTNREVLIKKYKECPICNLPWTGAKGRSCQYGK